MTLDRLRRWPQRAGSPSGRPISRWSYYARFGDEIDEAIALNRRPLEELRERYPSIAVDASSGE